MRDKKDTPQPGHTIIIKPTSSHCGTQAEWPVRTWGGVGPQYGIPSLRPRQQLGNHGVATDLSGLSEAPAQREWLVHILAGCPSGWSSPQEGGVARAPGSSVAGPLLPAAALGAFIPRLQEAMAA